VNYRKREGSCRLRGVAKSAGGRSSNADVAERFREAAVRKKARSTLATKRGDLIALDDRNKAIDLLNEVAKAGLPMKAMADLLGICGRTLRRWRLDISVQGFSLDRRKGALRQVALKFTPEERQKVIDTINDPRFADLPPGLIVAILAEEQQYVGSEMTIYRIMREAGLLNHQAEPVNHASPGPFQCWRQVASIKY